MTQTLSSSLTSIIQKYNLDISIISVSEIEGLMRVEAEFYNSIFLERKKKLGNKKYTTLGEIANVYSGPAYSSEEIKEIGGEDFYPIVKIGDVTNKRNIEQLDFVSRNNVESFGNKFYHKNDILVSMTGDPWNVGGAHMFEVVDNKSVVYNQRVACIRKKENEIPLYYLFVFLDSEYSRYHIERWAMGIRQRNASINDIRTILIPLPSLIFQSRIAELVQEAHSQRELSRSLYAEAEQIFLTELGLIGWIPTEVGITEKMSEEVKLFGRCDAEFFQPKYDELFERLTKFQTQKLGDIVNYQKGVEPGADAYSETGIPFIRVADVSIDGIDSIEKNISPELLEEYGERYSPKKDEILFTKDGTIGISFVVNEDMRAVLSGAFLRLQKKIDIESEYLALVLNSVVSKMQIERFSGGAIIAHLKPIDAMEILIPIVSPDIQSLISSRIIASHSAREKLKTLLEWANRAVEIFIEEDESIAREFLRGL